MMWNYAIIVFVALQRLSELVVSARNTRALKARGAVEIGAEHYPVMVVLHAAWLLTMVVLVGGRAISLPLLGVFALLQLARIWVLTTLGSRWTTRIIVLPGAPLVTSGPFRFVKHPNYCVVAAEIVVLPLVFGLVWVAVIFSLLNAAMLWVRIGAEHRALYGVRPA